MVEVEAASKSGEREENGASGKLQISEMMSCSESHSHFHKVIRKRAGKVSSLHFFSFSPFSFSPLFQRGVEPSIQLD